MTPEMLNFHQVISELEVAEENMLDNHKQTTDELLATYEKALRLLRMTDEVTYDQEGNKFFFFFFKGSVISYFCFSIL